MTALLIVLGVLGWLIAGHLSATVGLRSPMGRKKWVDPVDPDNVALVTIALFTWPVFLPMTLLVWAWSIWSGWILRRHAR